MIEQPHQESDNGPDAHQESYNTGKINRLEIIDHTISLEEGGGRNQIKWAKQPFSVELSVQDDGRTLKVFLTELEEK